MFCSRCGTRLPAGSHFCEECGTALPAVQTAAPPQVRGAGIGMGQQPGQVAATMAPAQAIQFNPQINVTVAAPQAQAMPGGLLMVDGGGGVPLVLRAVWFVFVGLWLGLLWLIAAWLLNVTILGLPLGLAMINRTPQVMTLKSSRRRARVTMYGGGTTFVTVRDDLPQVPLVLRALYFLIIGIWLSLLWTLAAWVAAALILPLPLSFWMFDRLPTVTTLRLT